MSRSVKDLREIINVSRLSMRVSDETPEEEENESDVALKQFLTAKRSQSSLSCFDEVIPVQSRSLSAPVPHASPPATRPKTAPPSKSANRAVFVQNKNPIPPIRKNFDWMFEHMDVSAINGWLTDCNANLHDFTTYLKSNSNFVQLCDFFLTKIPTAKRNELLDLEFSIIIDHLKYAFRSGYQSGAITANDIDRLAKSVVHEYPKKFKGGSEKILRVILIFCREKDDSYRSLLKKVNCDTLDKQNIQWLLAIRAFSLINFAIGLINFFKNIVLVTSSFSETPECVAVQGPECLAVENTSIDDWIIQAVKQDLVEVCNFLLKTLKGYPFVKVKDTKQRNLVYIALVERNIGMLDCLLQHLHPILVNEASENGNSALQYAVTKGDMQMCRYLIERGARVNVWNAQCDGATPLHTAVMMGDEGMVTLLLENGADVNARMGVPATITPYTLACQLNHVQIACLLNPPPTG